ncbi:MAG: hypothetical protein H0W13_10410 [Nitrospirales bacterium]|nr:hypothetical protein [Nitrospirales bacterium]
MDIQKPVREFLRAADIVLDRFKSGHPFSEQEAMMLQAYSIRIAACLMAVQCMNASQVNYLCRVKFRLGSTTNGL